MSETETALRAALADLLVSASVAANCLTPADHPELFRDMRAAAAALDLPEDG